MYYQGSGDWIPEIRAWARWISSGEFQEWSAPGSLLASDDLPFLSGRCCYCRHLVTKLYLNLLWPHGLYVAHQAALSMGFPRQEHRSGVPFPSPGGPPDPGIEYTSPALTGIFLVTVPPGKPRGGCVYPSDLLDGITNSINMDLSKLQESVEDRGACLATVHGVRKSWKRLGDWKHQQNDLF